MKKLIASILFAVAGTAFANTTITLTPEQAAQLAGKTTTQQVAGISEAARQEVSAWGELGSNMGKAMVGAAKEIGVAANEFSQTPLGKVTVALVVYKLIGEDLAGKVVGGGILILMLSVAIWFLRTSRFSDVEYTYVPVMWGAFSIKREVKRTTSDDAMIGRIMGALVSAVFGMFVGLMTMF